MQLKIRRSQRDGGIIAKTAVFCIDARVQFTAREQDSITRYKLGSQVIYNSEASKRLLDKAEVQRNGSTGGALKSLATLALAAMKLNISINSLERGQRVECKSLDELMAAEDAIMQACENLKGYLDTAATFDGREVLFDFATGSAQAVAMAATPEPMLIVEPQSLPAPMLAIESTYITPEHDGHDDAPNNDATDGYAPQVAMSVIDQIKRNIADIPVPLWVAAVFVIFLLYLKFG